MDRSVSFSVAPGAHVRRGSSEFKITRLLGVDSVLAEDLDSGIPERLRIADLAPLEAREPSGVPIPDLNLIPADKRHEAERRLNAIAGLIHRSDRTNAEVAEAAREAKVHPSTVWEWIGRYEASRHLTSLLPGRCGRRPGIRLITAEQEAIVSAAIEDHWLNTQSKQVVEVIRAVQRACTAAGLTPPHGNTVRRRINALDKRTALRRRGDHDGARRLESIVGQYPPTTRPFQVVQIDHTQGDVILVAGPDRMPFKRPWITLAIDVHTRMVVGSHVSYENPNAFSVGQVICQAMLRKEAVLEALGLRGPWPVWGLIGTVFVDNAMEFRSETMRAACAQYRVGLEYRPPATPHYGGHIERLMGTLATALRNLPGATFSNPKERKHYDSLKEAALTLDEFEVWLVRWLVEFYNNNRIHSGLDTTPLAKWTSAIEGVDPGRPGSGHLEPITDETRMRIDFLPAKRREVERGQIRLHNIRYAGPELDRFNASENKFTVRYDPRKLSPIWFWDPDAQIHVPLQYADLTLRVVSLWELIEIRRALRAKGLKALDPIAFEQTIRDNDYLVDTAKATTRAAQRARVRREATKRAEGVSPAQPHNARLPPAPLQPDNDDDWSVPEDRPKTIVIL